MSLDNLIQIFKGKCYSKPRRKSSTKVIVFDLDETLGCFTDLEIIWTGLHQCFDIDYPTLFSDLLDLYPEFIRFGIFPVLEYLYRKKLQGRCEQIHIYTNNQCSPTWTTMIADYFHAKVQCAMPPRFQSDVRLFDKLICAFKINNRIIEVSRTTHEKTHSDFIRCTLMPKYTEICFVDNSFFSDMVHEQIYYIQPRSYYHPLSTVDIVSRLLKSNILDYHQVASATIRKPVLIDKTKYQHTNPTHMPITLAQQEMISDFLFKSFYKRYAIRERSYPMRDEDIYVAQKLMYHIKEFFYLSMRPWYTKKKRLPTGKNTRKYRCMSL